MNHGGYHASMDLAINSHIVGVVTLGTIRDRLVTVGNVYVSLCVIVVHKRASEEIKVVTNMARSNNDDLTVPFDQLWQHDVEVVEDQLYCNRALTDLDYADALRAVIEEKRAQGISRRAVDRAAD